jgi:hypothetical protein
MQVKLLKMLYNGGGGGWPPSPPKNDPTIMKLAIVQTNQLTQFENINCFLHIYRKLYI